MYDLPEKTTPRSAIKSITQLTRDNYTSFKTQMLMPVYVCAVFMDLNLNPWLD